MNRRLLLVEDDPEIARVIQRTLQEEGYTVSWASTGREGWEDFCAEGIDTYALVLVDLMLPEMDGYTLCKNIRLKSNVPLLIISAKQEDRDKVHGLNIGADDYLAKPFSLSELTARVNSLIRRSHWYAHGNRQPAVTQYAHGLATDWEKRIVTLHGEDVALTGKELDLLQVLAENPRHTFSKTELYEHVWQQTGIGGNNTVTVHIKGLRQKLGDHTKEPYFIQTVWGQGYRFIGERIR